VSAAVDDAVLVEADDVPPTVQPARAAARREPVISFENFVIIYNPLEICYISVTFYFISLQ
jgi:hypothetical protein